MQQIPFGSQIGPYKVLTDIGTGGMSTVYIGEDTALGRKVALKHDLTGGSVDDFLREGKILANIVHPNVATVFGAEVDGAYHVLAMELLEGGTLEDRLKSEGMLGIPESTRITIQLLEALQHLHQQGVLHRDLKPSNAAFTKTGTPKLIDFGIAKQVVDLTNTLPGVGLLKGTPSYMAPEQVRGHRADFRSEVFSFGVIHYRMLTGQKPFDGDSLPAILHKVLQFDPPPPAMLRPEVPLDVSQVVKKALRKDPSARFQSAGEYLAALNACGTTWRTDRTRTATGSGRPVPKVAPDFIAKIGTGVFLVAFCCLVGLCQYFAVDWETVKNFGTVDGAVIRKEPVRVPESVRGPTGKMVVLVTVDERGRAIKSEIKTSSGNEALDQAARAAVERWRFRPERESWRAYRVRYEITLAGGETD